MTTQPADGPAQRISEWRPALVDERLRRDGKAVAKIAGKQIALFQTGAGVLACNNRCPHEGYPLSEGTLDGACTLTCNWHNWKFDLTSGANLYGGDSLRLYPTRLVNGDIWVDVANPPPSQRQARAYEQLRAAFEDHDYDRMARELARLAKAGGEPAEAVAAAIAWSHERLEYGTTHAYAAAEGWLRLHDETGDPELRLVCLAEAIGYVAWDVLREPAYPYGNAALTWDAAGFLAAIEAEDATCAVALLRGALAAGLHYVDLEEALTRAALSHYADFGHSLIYLVHTGRLIARLGAAVEAPLLLALVRSIVYARREDLIPEFRTYAELLAAWPGASGEGGVPRPEQFRRPSAAAAMKAAVEAAATAPPELLYPALLGAAALNLLQFDLAWQDKTDGTIAQNVGWLDFTHGVTFANAVRRQCTKFPDLWPAGLLQIACFIGRAQEFTTPAETVAAWRVADRAAFEASAVTRLADHGEDRQILAAHLLKTFLAGREEVAAGLPPEIETIVLASLNRFLNAPLKRKHVRRTAHQAMEFVALED